MQNNRGPMIFLGVIILLVFSYFLFQNQGKVFNWQENYNGKNVDPYGAMVITRLLEAQMGDAFVTVKKSLSSQFENIPDKGSTYIFIGPRVYYSESDREALLNFVSEGNAAFISANYFNEELFQELDIYGCTYTHKISMEEGVFNFYDEQLADKKGYTFNYRLRDKDKSYSWSYFDLDVCNTYGKEEFDPEQYEYVDPDDYEASESYEDEEEIDAFSEEEISEDQESTELTPDNHIRDLGYLEDYGPNFIQVDYGEGKFLIHCNPIVFSNYHLRSEKKLEYVEKTLASLPRDKVFWDEYSKVYHFENQSESDMQDGPLNYILSQPSLRWAWYLILAGVLIFFIFFSKRRQRVIPILPEALNSSIEYAETVGRLYYSSEDHFKLFSHQYHLFQADIRRLYQIQTPAKIEADFIERLSLKSAVPIQILNDIFSQKKRLEYKRELSNKELIEFYQLLDKFHKLRK